MKVPKQFDIEVTNRCNLKCKFCPNTRNDGFPVGDMEWGLFQSIVDRIEKEAPDSVVVAWLNGEPFLHPKYLDMVRLLSERGLKFYTTTNLTIWNEELLRFLLSDKSTCYQLIVSMDGVPGSKSLELARPGTDGEALVRNAYRLLRLKDQMRSEKDIAFKICERGQDWEEIEEYVRYWLEDTGVDYVCVGKPLKEENSEGMRRHPCQYSDNNFMVIRWDGTLVLCAYNDRAANGLLQSYGKLDLSTPLLEYYNNREIEAFRHRQERGDFRPPCDTCGFAYTGKGFKGEVTFRGSPETKYYYHQDYYNMFFSKVKDWKPDGYYRRG